MTREAKAGVDVQELAVAVADGVHAYVQLDGSWGLNNTGFLVGSAGVTAIEQGFDNVLPSRSHRVRHRSRALRR